MNGRESVHYSLRRHYVDQFHFRHIARIPPKSLVLDVGGAKRLKRGLFNIAEYDLQPVYVNLYTDKGTDVQADAAVLPFADECFDAAICSELLEHVPEPLRVLEEIHRIPRPAGILLLCFPFLYPIHGDPSDYGRYTHHFCRTHLPRIGFSLLEVEQHGNYWSVLADMLRVLAVSRAGAGITGKPLLRQVIITAARLFKRWAIAHDAEPIKESASFHHNFTTGFGVVASKPAPSGPGGSHVEGVYDR